MNNLELNFSGSTLGTAQPGPTSPPALPPEEKQPGLAPGSYWTVLTPKQQERILIATVREALADEQETTQAPAKVLPATEELRRHAAKMI